MDHRTGTHCGTGSPDDPSRGSESPNGSKKAENSDQEDEIEELDVREFIKLIQQFIKDPLDFINSSPKTKKKFIDWINYENAEDILKQYNILKRYNNELHPGIWIQDRSLDFSQSSNFDWMNFRYANGSGPSDKPKFLEDNKFLVNYWSVDGNSIPKLRKYYRPKKALAVIVQFDDPDPRPPKSKKRKLDQVTPDSQAQNSSDVSAQSTTGIPNTYFTHYGRPSVNHSNALGGTQFNYSASTSSYVQSTMGSNIMNSGFGSGQLNPPFVHANNYEQYNDPNGDATYQQTSYPPYSMNNNTNHSIVEQHSEHVNNNDEQFSYFQEHSNGEMAISNTNETAATLGYNQVDSNEVLFVHREEFNSRVQEMNEKMNLLHLQVNHNKTNVENLAQSFSHLQVQTHQNTADICRLDTEVLGFISESERPMLNALVEIFKKDNGTTTPGSKLANNVRKILNKTREELPDRIVSNFLHNTLVARGIVKVHREEKKCTFNKANALKYGLQI